MAVAVFDWSAEDPAVTSLTWPNYEHTLQEQHRELMYVTNSLYRDRTEAGMLGVCLMEIVLINPKILGGNTMEEVLASFKRNMNIDFRYFFVIFRGIDGFASSAKKYPWAK